MSRIEPTMTPIEETIQRLMEPDKHGEKGKPTRSAFGSDSFSAPVQRTLDALWKFAEGTAAASRDNMDHYDQAVARVEELEDQIRREGRMISAQQSLREVLRVEMDQLRDALKSANEICRSAFAIADREGQTTNWQAFRARTKESLALQHRTLFPEQ